MMHQIKGYVEQSERALNFIHFGHQLIHGRLGGTNLDSLVGFRYVSRQDQLFSGSRQFLSGGKLFGILDHP